MDENKSKDKSFGKAPYTSEPVSDANISYEELLKIKQRFEEMQVIAKFGMWDWDIKSNEYILSDGACHIYGIDTKTNKLDYESFVNFMHPDDREAARAALRAAMDERRPYSIDYRVIRSDGEIRHVHEYGSAVYDNGAPVRAFGSIKDNTENMIMHDKLKESELLYRTLFENTVDAFLIVELIYDANGKVCDFKNIRANSRFEEHTGLNPVVAIGRLASESKPDTEPYWIETFEKVAITGKPLHYQNFHKYTNRWYDVYCFPYTQDRIGAIFRDITQYRAAEEALHEANESNAQILESINEGYGMFDRDGNILNIGKKFAERFGKTVHDCIGTNITDHLSEEAYGDLGRRRVGYIQKVFDKGEPLGVEDTRDGRWFRNRYFPVFADGKVNAVSLFWTDITDSKKVEEEARKNAQLNFEAEMLRKKEQEYLELLDGPEEGMWIIDFREKRFEFSPKWAKRLGVSDMVPEKLFGNIDNYIHKDDAERVLNERLEFIKKRQPRFSQELRFLTADSGYIWVLDRGKIIYDETGAAVKVYASSMNITERKLAEEALRESEEKYKVLMKFAPAGIYEVDLRTRRFLSVNDEMCRLSGYDKEELLAMNILDLLNDHSKSVFMERQNRWLNGEHPEPFVEFKVVRKDGHVIDALLNSTFTFDENGRPLGATVIAQDITERKKMEEALKTSEEMLRTVLDMSLDGITRFNYKTGLFDYLSTSAAGILGYSVDELLFRDKAAMHAMVHPDDAPGVLAEIERLEKTGEATAEYRQRHKNGTYVWMSNHMSIVRDDKGSPAYRYGNLRNVTERKRRELNTNFLNDIEEDLSRTSEPEKLMASVGEAARRHFGISRLTFYEVDQDSDTVTGIFDGHDEGLPSALGLRRLSDYVGLDLITESRSGRVVVTDNVLCDPRFACRADAYLKTSVRSQMVASFVNDGKLRFIITAQHVEPRHWRDDEIELLGELAARLFPQVERARAEAALRESEGRLRFVLESCNIGAWDMDLEKHTTIRNPEHDRIYGYDSMLPEWTYEMFLEHVIPEDRDRVDTVFQQAVKAKVGWTFEFRIRRPDGRLRWIWATGNHKKDPDGMIRRAAGTIIDVTEKKLAEEALRERESRLQAILDSLPSAVLITDPAGQTAESNRALREVWGENAPIAAPELYKEYRGWWPETGKRLEAHDWPLAKSVHGEIVRNAIIEIESFDGKRKFIRADSSPIIGPHGENYGAVAINEDITEIKSAEQALGKALLREQVLGDITSRLLESDDPQSVIEDICRETVGYIEGDVFFNYICEGGRLHLNACSGIPDEEAEKLEWLEYGEAVCGCAARDGKRIFITDVQTSADPKVQPLKSFGLHCYASFPLKSDDHVIGTIAFGSRKRNAFTDDELLFLSSVSGHVAIAMNRLMISRALRESEDRYRRVVQNTSAVILRLDSQGIIRFANQRAIEFFGYEEDELVGKPVLGTMVPERDTTGRDLAIMVEEITADPERFHTNTNENMRKSGERVWMEWTNSGIYDSEGNLKEFLAVGIDATERKRAEEKINHHNVVLQAIKKIYEQYVYCGTLEELGNACLEIIEEITGSRLSFVGEIGQDGLFHDIAICMTGWEERELQDKAGHKRMPGSFKIEGLYGSVLKTGKSVISNAPYSHPESASIPKEHIALTSFLGVPFFQNSSVAGMVAVANREGGYTEDEKEILETLAPTVCEVLLRKRTEEALKDSEEKYRELVEHSPAGIYEVDFRTGMFTSVNDAMCFITGYSREEFLSMTPFQLLDEENAAKFRQRIKQWMSGDEPQRTVDYKLTTKDGRELYALFSVKLIKDEQGSLLGASVIANDITGRKMAEDRINRQNLILQTINSVYGEAVNCATQHELGEKCLDIIRSIIGNNAGFIGEVGKDGTLQNIAFNLGTEMSNIPETMLNHARMDGAGVVGLYRSVIENAKSILTNEPSSHPDSTGIPEGHYRITSFLGVPFVQSGKVLGLIGLANKEGGFIEEDRLILEAVTPSILEVLLRKRMEEALKESESKYEMLVKYAPSGIYEMDFRTRRFTSVNDALCSMSGYSREELLEIDPAVLMDERGKAIFLSRVELWMRGKEPKRNIDYKLKAKGGQDIFVSLDVSFKKDEDGKPIGVTAIVHDITQRKKDEGVINRKNRILQVINHIHETSVSCGTMNELELACLETVNTVMGSGVSLIGELKGERLMYEISLIPGTENGKNNVHRRLGRLNKEGLFKDVIDKKTSLLIDGDPSCSASTGVSGSEIEIVPFLGVPFIRDGEVFGLIAAANRKGGYTEDEKEMLEALAPAIYEVLMRKRAEEALNESEERLADEFNAVMRIHKISASFVQEGDLESVLYNILKAAIMISGAYKGTLQLLRPGTERLEIAAQLGFDQSYIEFLYSMSRDGAGVCAKALQQGKRVIVEDVTKSPIYINTPSIDVQLAAGVRAVQSTPLINRRGKVIGILSTHWDRPCYASDHILRYIDLLAAQASDIIERKWAEEELRESEECALALVKKLEEADRNKNDFLSSLSHEIRNPLATISAGLQLMDVSHDEIHIKNAKEIINRQMDQLCSLVDELLDLTRISNNKIELKKQRLELGRLVSLVAKDHIPLAGKKGLVLETELCEDIYIDADPVRIKQIIGNLLHNAFKFTDIGTVILSVYEENGHAVICVKDPGIGISPDNLSRIFEPFMQLGNHEDRKGEGLGLGLSIVRAIAQFHGGDAGAYSEGEGKGSEFYIRLPVLKNEAAEQMKNESGGAALKRLKVLAIEDNKDYSEMMCELLRFLGHDVISAPDGIEGIKKAKENVPDVIICDIGLPGISGYETARRIRNDESLKNVFLVSLTGYAGPQYAEDAKKAGFDLHITKPADIDALRYILNEACKNRS